MVNGESVISVPQEGGALQGIGELFAADLQTGTGNFTIPIELPAGRNGFQPALRLGYSTGNGNGYFGLGWSLGVPMIRRRTTRGVPRYDDIADTLVLAGVEELVRVAAGYPGTARYRPRTEGLFGWIEHIRSADENYWLVSSTDGIRTWYGTPRPTSTLPGWTDPAVTRNHVIAAQPVVEWLATRTIDPFGNEIRYSYNARDAGMEGAHHWDQPLLTGIAYVDHGAPADPDFVVRVAPTRAGQIREVITRQASNAARPNAAARSASRAARMRVELYKCKSNRSVTIANPRVG
jgi:Salmonella virulence plasmid 65kDa B protein